MFNNSIFKKLGVVLGLLTLLSVSLTIIEINLKSKDTGSVKSVSDDVTVSVQIIGGCILDIKAHMERRYNDNMSTILNIQFFTEPTDTYFGQITVTTDSDGEAVVNACNEGLYLGSSEYITRVRGYSHLLKKFEDTEISGNITDLDYTEGESFEFFAGETSNIFDNKINSLDISTQIQHLYSNNYKNDLTQDGKVNSLDISNTVDNFFMEGDE